MTSTARRVATVLLVFLLVTSIVPAATTAQEVNECELRDSMVVDWILFNNCEVPGLERVDTDQSASLIKTDLHVTGQGIYERQQAADVLTHNYLQDTETIALLEARHAIANAYEDGESATQAEVRASQAVYDYYSRIQQNALEQHRRDVAQYQYMRNVTENSTEIDDDFVHPWPVTFNGLGVGWSGSHTQNISNTTSSTVNGTAIEYPTVWGSGSHENTHSGHQQEGNVHEIDDPFDLEAYEPDIGKFRTGDDNDYHWGGGFQLQNHPDAGLESETILDFSITAEAWHAAADQAEQVTNQFENTTLTEDLYSAMDSGQLAPGDVRGAEGTVRYLSGDAENVTEESYQYALRSVLDLGRSSDLETTFTVAFNGSTERDRVTDGSSSSSYEYNSVNETYQGMLFASDAPDGGFVVNETYNVSALNGSTMMVTTEGEDVHFYRGNMTIEGIEDANGQSLESVEWSAGPAYQTYNASEFIAALENASDERSQIVGWTSDGGFNWDDIFGGGGWLGDGGMPIAAVGIALAVVIGLGLISQSPAGRMIRGRR